MCSLAMHPAHVFEPTMHRMAHWWRVHTWRVIPSYGVSLWTARKNSGSMKAWRPFSPQAPARPARAQSRHEQHHEPGRLGIGGQLCRQAYMGPSHPLLMRIVT